jgi:hypothetical protein
MYWESALEGQAEYPSGHRSLDVPQVSVGGGPSVAKLRFGRWLSVPMSPPASDDEVDEWLKRLWCFLLLFVNNDG